MVLLKWELDTQTSYQSSSWTSNTSSRGQCFNGWKLVKFLFLSVFLLLLFRFVRSVSKQAGHGKSDLLRLTRSRQRLSCLAESSFCELLEKGGFIIYYNEVRFLWEKLKQITTTTMQALWRARAPRLVIVLLRILLMRKAINAKHNY